MSELMQNKWKGRTGGTGGVASLVALLLVLTVLHACVPYSGIATQQVNSIDPNPSYTLILYGGRYSDDIENLAILDPEDDPYKFEIYAPDFDYRVYPHVSAQEALERAEKHVGFHPSFRRSMCSAAYPIPRAGRSAMK
ncbi:MAG: hypothetical protein MZV70_58695 [Desulfobacterales bacterium]|nr:hypothetical protein [Desulfobacterales bacterium]